MLPARSLSNVGALVLPADSCNSHPGTPHASLSTSHPASACAFARVRTSSEETSTNLLISVRTKMSFRVALAKQPSSMSHSHSKGSPLVRSIFSFFTFGRNLKLSASTIRPSFEFARATSTISPVTIAIPHRSPQLIIHYAPPSFLLHLWQSARSFSPFSNLYSSALSIMNP